MKSIHFVLRKLGYRIVRIEETSKTSGACTPFFALLKQLGFTPKHILDIGANHGRWTREAIMFFPEARYTLVEPQGNLKSHIQDLVDRGHRIQWINAGANDRSGTMQFTVAAATIAAPSYSRKNRHAQADYGRWPSRSKR